MDIQNTSEIVICFEDGRRVPVALRLSDTIGYSMVWRKRQWPSPEEDKMMVGAYSAFAAARRLGHFAGSFEAFTEAVLTLELTEDGTAEDDDTAGAEAGEPVPTSAGIESSTPAPTPAPTQAGIEPTPAPLTAPEPTLPTPGAVTA